MGVYRRIKNPSLLGKGEPIMTHIPRTESRIANSTRVWQFECGISVTGWNKSNEFILSTFTSSNAAHGSSSGTYKLQWRREGGVFTDVTATSEICWGVNTSLVDENSIASPAGCIGGFTPDADDGHENEGNNSCILPKVDAGGFGEIQWALGFGSGALNEQKYEFQLVCITDSTSAICSVAITTAVGAAGWTGEILGVTNPSEIMGILVSLIEDVMGI